MVTLSMNRLQLGHEKCGSFDGTALSSEVALLETRTLMISTAPASLPTAVGTWTTQSGGHSLIPFNHWAFFRANSNNRMS